MIKRTEPVSELVTHFRGSRELADMEVARQISTRLPLGCIAAVEAVATHTGLSKAQVYVRVIEAGLRSFRMALEPAELKALRATEDQALDALIAVYQAEQGGEVEPC